MMHPLVAHIQDHLNVERQSTRSFLTKTPPFYDGGVLLFNDCILYNRNSVFVE